MAEQRSHIWPRLALFLLVTIGAAIVWGGVAAFIVEGLLGPAYEVRDAEGLAILSDGEPVIISSIYHRPPIAAERLPVQSLDRRPVERGDRETVSAAYFYRSSLESRQVHTTRGYEVRVIQLGENRRELTDEFYTARWYAVRDDSEEGRGHVVGYDVASKLPLGYFGRRGFANSPPDPAEQFVLGDLHRRTATIAWSKGDDAPTSFAYLLDGDRLVEIDSLRQTMREVAELPESLMLQVGLRPKLIKGGEVEDAESDETPMERVIVVWQGDRFSVVAPRSGDVESFRLPDEMSNVLSFAIHVIGPGVAVIQYNRDPYDYDNVRLLWITADGNVTREETVHLAGYRRQSERVEATKATAIVPVPLLMGALAVLGAPFSSAHQGKSFGEAVPAMLAAAWPPFVALFVISAALACWVWTVHRRDGRPNAGIWAGLVFLLGPAAWLAYVAERPRTPGATCPACGKRSPRNRVECAACGEDAFKPRPLGAEVFA